MDAKMDATTSFCGIVENVFAYKLVEAPCGRLWHNRLYIGVEIDGERKVLRMYPDDEDWFRVAFRLSIIVVEMGRNGRKRVDLGESDGKFQFDGYDPYPVFTVISVAQFSK